MKQSEWRSIHLIDIPPYEKPKSPEMITIHPNITPLARLKDPYDSSRPARKRYPSSVSSYEEDYASNRSFDSMADASMGCSRSRNDAPQPARSFSQIALELDGEQLLSKNDADDFEEPAYHASRSIAEEFAASSNPEVFCENDSPISEEKPEESPVSDVLFPSFSTSRKEEEHIFDDSENASLPYGAPMDTDDSSFSQSDGFWSNSFAAPADPIGENRADDTSFAASYGYGSPVEHAPASASDFDEEADDNATSVISSPADLTRRKSTAFKERSKKSSRQTVSRVTRQHCPWFLRHLNTGIAMRLSTRPIIIGSSTRCDYVIEFDSNLSRRHLSIEVDDNRVYVEDLGSTNHSYIDNTLLSGRCELQEDQVLRLGGSQIFEIRYCEED